MTGDDPNSAPGPTPDVDVERRVWLTIPNMLCEVRLVGSLFMLWLAYAGLEMWFIGAYFVLLLTDWVDGKLAILLHQRTVLGARLDSIADAVLYGALLLGTAWLRPDFIESEGIMVAAMLASYLVSVLISLFRFKRLPAYHTRAAKTCWFLASVGAIVLLLDGPMWPARVALIAGVITNIEAWAIGLVLNRWTADVPSIYHAYRLRKQE